VGAKPYERQVFDYDATVVERLRAAGAVLVAKLTTGELAIGDLWFGGRTRNPWNPDTAQMDRRPAIEYIRAQRVRTLLIQRMNALFANIDAFVSPFTRWPTAAWA
jgi:Asp-tRNA(Asn)/Glu-tRNA(Gln) amidotransferase A subunit family amidase